MSKNIFNDTEIAYKLKSKLNLYNAKFLFIVITKKILVSILTQIVLFYLKFNIPVKWILKRTIYSHFCGGINLEECSKTIHNMKKMGVYSILDFSIILFLSILKERENRKVFSSGFLTFDLENK